jgi:hypothetical protein
MATTSSSSSSFYLIQLRLTLLLLLLIGIIPSCCCGWLIGTGTRTSITSRRFYSSSRINSNNDDNNLHQPCNYGQKVSNVMKTDRREFMLDIGFKMGAIVTGLGSGAGVSTMIQIIEPVYAIGPIKLGLQPLSYNAVVCPRDKPIPGQKAMVGMKGMCVTVTAKLLESTPKLLDKVGVYGFITDGITGDSVLANNPDLSTDAGQFAMIETISTTDNIIQFEFIAAVPQEKDLSIYENGIGPLKFDSLRIISYPGGQQFGAISPCEMNEFSDECEVWENENGPYERQEYMIKKK